jgi:hypothetical protein
MKVTKYLLILLMSVGFVAIGCGDDDGNENEADEKGVGAQCETSADCQQPEDDAGMAQECLTEFTGGYCGIEDCASNEDCPEGSACVDHDNGNEYCFRVCDNKPECNANRDEDVEANCSANIEFVDDTTPDGTKACVPPSGS